jgi:8-oxo-dGTP pyrophosphatase MutT (NUDIX family)
MKRIASKTVYRGQVIGVRLDSFRFDDGEEAEREIAEHPGAAAILAHDAETLWMVRQPREAVGEESLLELPAGKLDVEGETPLECARRELVEEVGLEAGEWRELKRFYTSPGFAEEIVYLFEATELREVEADPGEGERIEIVRHPLAELDRAIAECEDAKSLIGLLLLRFRLTT